jgi:3-hydroxyisobutyrate dehydrogenase
MQSVGLVGIGRMGEAIARRLLAAGFRVRTFDRDEERSCMLAGAGAQPVNTLDAFGDVVCDVHLLSLPDERAVEEVAGRLARILPAGAVIADLSTASPEGARNRHRALGTQGIHWLDAPVSGGVWGAAAGDLVVMVGGDPTPFAAVEPVLAAIAASVVHVGPPGDGATAKLLHNMVGELQVQGFAEAMCAGIRLGLDAARLFECLAGGMASSRVLTRLYAHGAFRDRERVHVRLDAAAKDQDLLLEMAHRAGLSLTFSPLVRERLASLQAQGYGARDVTSTISRFEDAFGVRVPTFLGDHVRPNEASPR